MKRQAFAAEYEQLAFILKLPRTSLLSVYDHISDAGNQFYGIADVVNLTACFGNAFRHVGDGIHSVDTAVSVMTSLQEQIREHQFQDHMVIEMFL